MQLNEEVVKKSLDWLDSLVGNSNDSDIALLTYQLLGILYDTCEELTAKVTKWEEECDLRGDMWCKLNEENKRLAEENERLRAESEKTQILSVFPKEEELKYLNALEQMAKEYKTVRADTVRKMQERLKAYFGTYVLGYKISLTEALKAVNQIAKEMLEGEK